MILKVTFRMAVLGVAAMCLGVEAGANDTWLQPEKFVVAPGALLLLEVRSAPEFGSDSEVLGAKRVASVIGHVGAEPVRFGLPSADERFAVFARFDAAGVAACVAALVPETRQLGGVELERYLRQNHAPEAVRAAWITRIVRESRRMTCKVYVRVGGAEGPRALPVANGVGFELQAEADPTSLVKGSHLPLRLFRDRKPVADAVVTVRSADGRYEHVVVTDAEGRAQAELSASGAWLVRAVDMKPSSAAESDWETDVAVLLLDVK